MKKETNNFSSVSKKSSQGAGIGLIELMISLSVGILVVSTLTAVGISGLKNVRVIDRYRDLQSDAVYITDTFTYWIKQGDLLAGGGNTLAIRLSPSVTKTFSFSGNNIELDGVKLNTNNVKISGGSFTLLPRSAKISFTLNSTLGDETMTITTTGTQRNHP